jgi:dTDP-4-dehydrorhamnose reductase
VKIAIFGTTGMLGHEVFRVFSDINADIISVNRDKVNAQLCSVGEIQNQIYGADWVINCVGIIKPYIHDDSSYEVRRAIEVNSLFPHSLAQAAKNVEAKVIQIATDCVYDGNRGFYTEIDPHNAIDVYGKSKSLGEIHSDNFINLRCSIIGKENKNKLSLLEMFLNQPKGAKIKGYKNHLWNGVTTTAFAKICAGIIQNDITIGRLHHIVPADIMNKSDMLHEFREIFCRYDIEIEDIETEISIDRTLSTTNKKRNEIVWNVAGYKKIPTIKEMIGNML